MGFELETAADSEVLSEILEFIRRPYSKGYTAFKVGNLEFELRLTGVGNEPINNIIGEI